MKLYATIIKPIIIMKATKTYCDVGVNFIFLSTFSDEFTVQFINTGGHYLEPFMILRKKRFQSFDFLLKHVEASH